MQVEKRLTTVAEPFHLAEPKRDPASLAAQSETTTTFEYHAKPAPKTTYEPEALPKPKSASPTEPAPFKLSSNEETHTLKRWIRQKEEEEARAAEEKMEAEKKKYKAKPAPDFSEVWKPAVPSKSIASEKVAEFKLSVSNFSRKPQPEQFDRTYFLDVFSRISWLELINIKFN